MAALAVGGYFALQAVTLHERDAIWQASVDKISSAHGVIVDDARTISIKSNARDECDPNDFLDFYGIVNRYLLDFCRTTAETSFADSVTAKRATLKEFTDGVGISSSFVTRLNQLRGLDGTLESDFDDSKAGALHVTYSYDGLNGLFVQVERKQ